MASSCAPSNASTRRRSRPAPPDQQLTANNQEPVMGDKSAIEWTDATWTPVRARVIEIQHDGSGKERIGWHCEHVSPGCKRCYAETMNRRLGTGRDYAPDELFRPERVG